MQEIAKELAITFIDLYKPTAKLMENDPNSLTNNGTSLNDRGYTEVNEIMAKALSFPVSAWNPDPLLTIVGKL